MTIQEAHTLWGRKADHILTYNKTKEVFEHGFKILDLNKATSFYSKKDLATALAYSDLTDAQKPIAASVMCHILNFAHEAVPNQQAAINFTHYELLNYKPVAPATDPAEPTSVLGVASPASLLTPLRGEGNLSVSEGGSDNDNVNDSVKQFSKTEKLTNSKTEKPTSSKTGKLINSKTEKPTNSKTDKNKTNMNKEKSVCDRKPKAVRQIDQETGKVVCTYASISEAERMSKVQNIRRAIERNGTAGGYVWEYMDSPSEDRNSGERRVKSEESKLHKGASKKVNAPRPSDTRHQTSLADISDQELIDEMKRRGWKGDVEIVVRVTL